MKKLSGPNLAAALLVLLAGIACGTTPTVSPPVTSTGAQRASPTDTPAVEPSRAITPAGALESAIPPFPTLEILSHTSYTDGGWYHIVGEVRNNSSVPMQYVKIAATLYDDAGNVVGTDFTYTELDVIPPGDKSPFETGTEQWQGATNYKLQTQGRDGVLPRQDLSVRGDQSHTEGSWLHIRGEVVNSGATPAEYVKVIATLYDAPGTVIGTDFTYTTLDLVPGGGTSPFEAGTDHWPDFDHYELHVQGR